MRSTPSLRLVWLQMRSARQLSKQTFNAVDVYFIKELLSRQIFATVANSLTESQNFNYYAREYSA